MTAVRTSAKLPLFRTDREAVEQSAFPANIGQFVDQSAHVARQLVVLAITFVVMAALNATCYTVFAASARKLLTSPRAQRRFNIAGGSLLTAAGVWGLLAKRSA